MSARRTGILTFSLEGLTFDIFPMAKESCVGRAEQPGERRGDIEAGLSTALASTGELVSWEDDLRLTHMKRWRCGCFRPIFASSS